MSLNNDSDSYDAISVQYEQISHSPLHNSNEAGGRKVDDYEYDDRHLDSSDTATTPPASVTSERYLRNAVQ